VVSHDLVRELAAVTHELNRLVGVLIDRAGRIEAVSVGDAKSVRVPREPSAPAGRERFCTLRWIATKPSDEPLSAADLLPLALHRLDALALVSVEESGAPGPVRVAHLLPAEEPSPSAVPESSGVPSPPGAIVPLGRAGGRVRRRREIEDVVADGGRYRIFPPRPAALLDEDFLEMIRALEQEFERRRTRTKIAGKAGRAILVHVTTGSRAPAEESMKELEELAASADLAVVDRILQKRQAYDSRTWIGSGRLEDLIVRASRLQAEFIVADQDLSPAQARALAEATALKVVDRSQLILDIFARRAKTAEGKIQVELAQLKYLLPRLMTRGDSGLSRLEGGIGGRGPGEQKLEIDRRRVRDRIRHLEKQLASERTRREQRRARRREREVPVVSLVGYTNAGKSTLLNVLTKSEVFVEHRMFATLDPSSRRLRLPREREIVINDTVGFIRDLPKDLIAAFRATLEEIEGSDLLVHLVDGSHPRYEAQVSAVESILRDLSYLDIPRLLVFNKADLLDDERRNALLEGSEALLISAANGEGIESFLREVDERLPVRARTSSAV
jgi:GTP-binding protein HflX